jgi:carbon starvation protein CstA
VAQAGSTRRRGRSGERDVSALSLVLGVVQKYLNPPLWIVTVVFVPLAFASAWAGTLMSNLFILDHRAWGLLILLYCCVASVTPVWLLLQPRGYLGGFVLYAALAVGVGGIFFGGYEIQQPAFNSFDIGGMTGALFPFLFVTIACGACSGFHGLVCSGTTSKQIDKEHDIHAVGYGAMLAEGFVALIALVTVMIVAPEVLRGKAPGTIYGEGIGRFLTLFVGEANYPFAVTFGAMAFSTFVFDTIDVSTRLGRYIVQELFGWRNIAGAVTGHALGNRAVRLFHIADRAELLREILDALRRVESTARRPDVAFNHRLALSSAQAHRVHLAADALCARRDRYGFNQTRARQHRALAGLRHRTLKRRRVNRLAATRDLRCHRSTLEVARRTSGNACA